MIRGIEGLISQQRWRLEDKRRVVAELERLSARLHQELADLDSMEGTASSAEAHDAVAAERRAKLNLSLTDIEERMRDAQAEVARAEREIKKYDLAIARRRRATRGPGRPSRQDEVRSLGSLLHRRPENV